MGVAGTGNHAIPQRDRLHRTPTDVFRNVQGAHQLSSPGSKWKVPPKESEGRGGEGVLSAPFA